MDKSEERKRLSKDAVGKYINEEAEKEKEEEGMVRKEVKP